MRKWIKKMPKRLRRNTSYILLIAYTVNGRVEFNSTLIEFIGDEEYWYWAWCEMDGNIIGDISDVEGCYKSGAMYCLIPQLKEINHDTAP